MSKLMGLCTGWSADIVSCLQHVSNINPKTDKKKTYGDVKLLTVTLVVQGFCSEGGLVAAFLRAKMHP